MINLQELSLGIAALNSALDGIRKVRDLLPANKRRDEIDEGIAEAERNTKLAEAQIAQALGYQLCRCKFPPIIMLTIQSSSNIEIFQCPQCKRKVPDLDAIHESFTYIDPGIV